MQAECQVGNVSLAVADVARKAKSKNGKEGAVQESLQNDLFPFSFILSVTLPSWPQSSTKRQVPRLASTSHQPQPYHGARTVHAKFPAANVRNPSSVRPCRVARARPPHCRFDGAGRSAGVGPRCRLDCGPRARSPGVQSPTNSPADTRAAPPETGRRTPLALNYRLRPAKIDDFRQFPTPKIPRLPARRSPEPGFPALRSIPKSIQCTN